ncbi:alpha/beta hydrolase [Polyangium aurulentum]|uniref:alpha/beta hydrolase n=1 Tax=Polyangium aurulentum TaxID=2567896 RepID=UPI0010AE47F1|nr:PHB depolymerase family esterase [Polyangium aurulentum]UQA57798.1 alpha/beta fold hydrolase [Polyangium aurulentum]
MMPPRKSKTGRKRRAEAEKSLRRKRIFRITLLAVTLVGLVAVPVCAMWTTPKAPASAAPPTRVTPETLEGPGARYRITLTNPTAWKRETPSKESDASLQLRHVASGAVLVVVEAPQDNALRTAEDVADDVLERMGGTQGILRVGREALPVRTGSALLLHNRNSTTSSEELTGIFVEEASAYIVSGTAPSRTFASVRAEMEAIIRSFSQTPPAPAPKELPPRVLALPAPPEPKSHTGTIDPRSVPADALAHHAREAAARDDYETAAVLQHWAVSRGYRSGLYDLACYSSRAVQANAALHWLERAAEEEGVDPSWADVDGDLDFIREDKRWGPLRAWLGVVSRYWQASGRKETRLVVPKGYQPGKPIPVLVGLHGMGSVPADFAGVDMQRFANAHSIAVVSASGTLPLGPHSYRWVESPSRDGARIEAALAEVADRVTIAPGKVVLIGFSQGAVMAGEIAARHPDRYAGAIMMSPGGRSSLAFGSVERQPAIEKRRFVVVVGEGERPGNVELAQKDAERLRTLGADVFHKVYAGQDRHAFPPDYETILPVWVAYLLGEGPKPKG